LQISSILYEPLPDVIHFLKHLFYYNINIINMSTKKGKPSADQLPTEEKDVDMESDQD
jgi:hypothetical protein